MMSNSTKWWSNSYTYDDTPSKLKCTALFAGEKCIGSIDHLGTFVPEISELDRIIKTRKKLPIAKLPEFPESIINPIFKYEHVYEYRKGMLIPMVFDKDDRLVPLVGGKIIDFKDYHYSPTARRIYNLPGRFVLKKDEPSKKP